MLGVKLTYPVDLAGHFGEMHAVGLIHDKPSGNTRRALEGIHIGFHIIIVVETGLAYHHKFGAFMEIDIHTVDFLTVEKESLVDAGPCSALGYGEAAVPKLLILLVEESWGLVAHATVEIH